MKGLQGSNRAIRESSATDKFFLRMRPHADLILVHAALPYPPGHLGLVLRNSRVSRLYATTRRLHHVHVAVEPRGVVNRHRHASFLNPTPFGYSTETTPRALDSCIEFGLQSS